MQARSVHLPDSPFLLGDLDPVAVLAPLVTGPVTVDNDVNWAARAERDHCAGAAALDDFAYIYLGEGLGCAVVSDGEVRRGHAGLAGEIAAVVALADPAQVVLGGRWGRHPVITAAVAAAVADLSRPVPVRAAALTAGPSLAGARADALARLRAAIVARAQGTPPS